MTLIEPKQDLVCNDPKRLFNALTFVIKGYFGLLPDKVDAEIIAKVESEIIKRYPWLTFDQLNSAYIDPMVVKKEGVALTIPEMLNPIENLAKKKAVVDLVLLSENQSIEERNRIKQEAIEFRRSCEKLYLDCLNGEKIWTGNEIQAHQIAGAFNDVFTNEKKLEFEKQARREYRERKEQYTTQMEEKPTNEPQRLAIPIPPPPIEKILSRIAIEEALKMTYPLVKE